MSIVIPDEGAVYLLRRLTRVDPLDRDPWEVRLFQNDYTPGPSTTGADFVESSFTGYARITVDPDDWTLPTIQDGRATCSPGPDPLVFQNVGSLPQWVFGFWVKRVASSTVVFCCRLPVPRDMTATSELLLDVPFTYRTDPQP